MANKIDASLLSLVIYQNDSFVDGLYQSIYGRKLSQDAQEPDGDGSGSVELDHSKKTVSDMSYAQSYSLHKVREALHKNDSIKQLNTETDFNSLSNSDFIEFSATFEKNDLITLLDLVTPQLGGVIGHILYAKDKTDEQFSQQQAVGQFELGKSIVEALHKEFRNETSSEFYGTVRAKNGKEVGVTSVLICDKEFFANADEDRILDGEFKVFGKVIAVSSTGVSKFERNKLLKRIKPAGTAWLTKKIAEQKQVDDYVDTSIEFDIEGKVVKIIPIAIYT